MIESTGRLELKHLAVCVRRGDELDAFVLSGPTWTKLETWAETFKNREGYCGWDSFQDAVDCCTRMQKRGAWILRKPVQP